MVRVIADGKKGRAVEVEDGQEVSRGVGYANRLRADVIETGNRSGVTNRMARGSLGIGLWED